MSRDISLYRRVSTGRGRTRSSGHNSFTISTDTSGLDAYLDGIADEVEEAVRPVAQAMVQVLYDRILVNVSMIGMKTGNLEDSIYQVYSKANSKDGVVATYHASWNHVTAPHGRLLEHGYIKRWESYLARNGQWYTNKDAPLKGGPRQIPGYGFVVRAAAAMPQAVDAGRSELLRRVRAVI